MHLTRSSGKSFPSAALWNSIYPISCFISFIFRSWVILPFHYCSSTFKLISSIVLVLIPWLLQVAGVEGSPPTSSPVKNSHWPGAGHTESLSDHLCGSPQWHLNPWPCSLRVPVTFVPLPALMFSMGRCFFCMGWKKCSAEATALSECSACAAMKRSCGAWWSRSSLSEKGPLAEKDSAKTRGGCPRSQDTFFM